VTQFEGGLTGVGEIGGGIEMSAESEM